MLTPDHPEHCSRDASLIQIEDEKKSKKFGQDPGFSSAFVKL
jgi:hypothetical protein